VYGLHSTTRLEHMLDLVFSQPQIRNTVEQVFFKGVLGTRFGFLESEKIIMGSLGSEKIGSVKIHIGYVIFS